MEKMPIIIWNSDNRLELSFPFIGQFGETARRIFINRLPKNLGGEQIAGYKKHLAGYKSWADFLPVLPEVFDDVQIPEIDPNFWIPHITSFCTGDVIGDQPKVQVEFSNLCQDGYIPSKKIENNWMRAVNHPKAFLELCAIEQGHGDFDAWLEKYHQPFVAILAAQQKQAFVGYKAQLKIEKERKEEAENRLSPYYPSDEGGFGIWSEGGL